MEPKNRLSQTLALSRQLVEELHAKVAGLKETVERSHEAIEESHRLIDKANRANKL